MALKPAICTQCGGKIDVDDSKEAGICPFCGTAFITEKVINQYVTQNNFSGATINIQGGVDTENLYTLARRAIQTNNKDDALKYYEMINQRNPNDWESTFYTAWLKNDDSLVQNILITIELLEKENPGNKSELYITIGNEILNSSYSDYWNNEKLGELCVAIINLNKHDLSELLSKVLEKLFRKVRQLPNEERILWQKMHTDVLNTLSTQTSDFFKPHMEFVLNFFINTEPATYYQEQLETAISHSSLIDKNEWLKKLYTCLFTRFNLYKEQYKDLKKKIENLDPSIISLRKLKTIESIERKEGLIKFCKSLVAILLIPAILAIFMWQDHPFMTILITVAYEFGLFMLWCSRF